MKEQEKKSFEETSDDDVETICVSCDEGCFIIYERGWQRSEGGKHELY